MNAWNSTLKTSNKPMKRGTIKRGTKRLHSVRPMKKIGKRGKRWIAVRRRLSIEYAAKGITSCELHYEGCFGEGALGFAHGRKRRHLKGDELETLTILACNPCHDKIEFLPAEEMLRIVQEVITSRR